MDKFTLIINTVRVLAPVTWSDEKTQEIVPKVSDLLDIAFGEAFKKVLSDIDPELELDVMEQGHAMVTFIKTHNGARLGSLVTEAAHRNMRVAFVRRITPGPDSDAVPHWRATYVCGCVAVATENVWTTQTPAGPPRPSSTPDRKRVNRAAYLKILGLNR